MIDNGNRFAESAKNVTAIQCKNCKKYFAGCFSVCPFCGTVVTDDAVPDLAGSANKTNAGAAQTAGAAVSSLPGVSVSQNNTVGSGVDSNNASNNFNTAKEQNKKYLWWGILCYLAAQLLAWLAPWTKLSTEDGIIRMFDNPKIHYLDYLENPGRMINNLLLKNEVSTGIYIFAMILMLTAAITSVVYLVMIMSNKMSKTPRGILASFSLIISSLLIEIYRADINSTLEKYDVAKECKFSSTGVSVAVIILAVAAFVCYCVYDSKINEAETKHTYICKGCGNTIKTDICPYCNTNNNSKKTADSYYCGNCGREGPYDGNCPICNSSLKKYYNPDTAEALPFQDGIKRLHTDEIVKRFFNSKEWNADYRRLCCSELIKRGFTNEDIINSGNKLNVNKIDGWFCPECARVNSADVDVCRCGYKKTESFSNGG